MPTWPATTIRAEALAHPGVDIVSICTPQHVHCAARAGGGRGRQAHAHRKAGRHQPRRTAARCARRCAQAGVQTVVGFVLRWNPLFRTLKALLADNALGRPYYVEADYLSHNGSWWSGWNDARTLAQGVSAMLGRRLPCDRRPAVVCRDGRVRGGHAGRGVSPSPADTARGAAASTTRCRTPGSTTRRRWNTTGWKWPW